MVFYRDSPRVIKLLKKRRRRYCKITFSCENKRNAIELRKNDVGIVLVKSKESPRLRLQSRALQ